jgi:hypothetical protein
MKISWIIFTAACASIIATGANAQSQSDIDSYATDMETTFRGSDPLGADITGPYPSRFVGVDASVYRCTPENPNPSNPNLYSNTESQFRGVQNCLRGDSIAINIAAFALQSDLTQLREGMDGVSDRLSGLENSMLAIENALGAAKDEADKNTTGIAMSFAMAGVGDIAPGETVAISANWGTFGGKNGFASGFAVRASERVSFNGGIAFGEKGGAVGGRAGIRLAW